MDLGVNFVLRPSSEFVNLLCAIYEPCQKRDACLNVLSANSFTDGNLSGLFAKMRIVAPAPVLTGKNVHCAHCARYLRSMTYIT